jgi:hypothetical protein
MGGSAPQPYPWLAVHSRPLANSRSFCRLCGIHLYGQGYVEELGGAFCSININCLDDVDPSLLTIGYWDGRNNNWHSGMRSGPWPLQLQR